MGGSSAAKRSGKTDTASRSSSPWTVDGVSTAVANGSPSSTAGGLRAAAQRPVNTALGSENHEAGEPRGNKVASAVLQTMLPAWTNVGIMVGLIFGGCCANVSVCIGDLLQLGEC